MTKQNHIIGQLEENVKDLNRKLMITENIKTELEITRDDLNRKTKDLQDVQVKINDNYKLVAELSNENLKLTGEKLRAEEMLEDVKKEHSVLKDELLSSRKMMAEAMKYGGAGTMSSSHHTSTTAINNNNNNRDSSTVAASMEAAAKAKQIKKERDSLTSRHLQSRKSTIPVLKNGDVNISL